MPPYTLRALGRLRPYGATTAVELGNLPLTLYAQKLRGIYGSSRGAEDRARGTVEGHSKKRTGLGGRVISGRIGPGGLCAFLCRFVQKSRFLHNRRRVEKTNWGPYSAGRRLWPARRISCFSLVCIRDEKNFSKTRSNWVTFPFLFRG